MKNVIVIWSAPEGFGETLSKKFPGETIKTITVERNFDASLTLIKRTQGYSLIKIFLKKFNNIRYIEVNRHHFIHKKVYRLLTRNLSAKEIDCLMYQLSFDLQAETGMFH